MAESKLGFRVDVAARIGNLDLAIELRGGATPLAIIGPNGSGKTTVLRIIAGALRPYRGDIELGGTTVFGSARGIDLPPEQRSVGYVPQGYGLFPHLRVIDNVAFGLSVGRRKRPRQVRGDVAAEMLAALSCSHLAERMPAHLSGGEQQRVALARALVIEPSMLLLDEPLAALDAGVRRSVRRFVAERLRALSRPSIVVTHDARDVAALDAHVCVLDRGRIVQRGSLAELRAAPANDFVAEFAER